MKFNNRNIHISAKARIGANVKIGDNTIIYDNVEIGDNSIICNDCIIGEPTSSYYTNTSYENKNTIIGPNALIRSHTIIYAGVSIGKHFETGHRVTIREASIIGNYCRVGTQSDLQGFLKMGNYCNLHSNVHLCQKSELGDFVFLYPFSILTNDKHPPSAELFAPKIGNYTQIGVHSVIVAGVQLGEHCLVGAHSTVSKSFDNYSFIIGSPAVFKSDVRELRSDSEEQLYPWKERFSRGMPWGNSDTES